jgi:peptide deformylase
MAIMPILHFPDPRLREPATLIDVVNDDVRRLIDDMLETMYEAPGIGLAAPQVNVHKRLIVIDISDDKSAPICLVNPQIVTTDGVEQTEEGCLSVPGVYEVVERAERVRVRALGRDGVEQDFTVDGLLAVCIQHEIDHLDGKLFVDYLSPLKQKRIRKKLEKQQRQAM